MNQIALDHPLSKTDNKELKEIYYHIINNQNTINKLKYLELNNRILKLDNISQLDKSMINPTRKHYRINFYQSK